ncbi:hypothetical protein [Archangium violaceum]|uniref:hypothetical protein n=1 Tax=Archangium violaceum TaxID=83451 RepID=UPI003D2E85BC
MEAGRARARGEMAMSEAQAASDADAATAREREWQLRRLPVHLRPMAFPSGGACATAGGPGS